MSNSPFIRDVPAAQALGAGTRVLLDHLLSQCGIAPDSITGNSREEPTHLAVAAGRAAALVAGDKWRAPRLGVIPSGPLAPWTNRLASYSVIVYSPQPHTVDNPRH